MGRDIANRLAQHERGKAATELAARRNASKRCVNSHTVSKVRKNVNEVQGGFREHLATGRKRIFEQAAVVADLHHRLKHKMCAPEGCEQAVATLVADAFQNGVYSTIVIAIVIVGIRCRDEVGDSERRQ